MTVNRTTLLNLPLPVTGTESGLWGDYTNNGFTEYVDTAVAGALSITASVTLANTTGTNSSTGITTTTAQYRTLIVPASGPSANVVITAPSSNRTYHVINRNATYTVQIRAGANSGVTLSAEQSATVAYDSVAGDYVLVGPIGPTVPVARGGTGATTLTANNVILGNGTSAVQFVAPGSNGNVLTSNGTTWTSAAGATGDVTAAGNNAFTGANTFYNATGQTFAPASTNDGIIVLGRAGGSSSYRVTLAPTTLSASRTLTLPDATGTVLTTATAVTVAQGGTGATSLTANNVLLGNGTSAVQVVAPGSSGNVLTSDGTTWTSAALSAGGFTSATNTSVGTGTSVTFTGIPSGTKIIIISLNNVWIDLYGLLIQLGTSGGITTSGYNSYGLRHVGGASHGSLLFKSNGFYFGLQNPGAGLRGQYILTLQNSSTNQWTGQGTAAVDSDGLQIGAGTVSLSGVCTQLRLQTETGGTFQSGSVNIMYSS